MCCGKCGGKGGFFCPLSLGLALGLTTALAVFGVTVWMMQKGVPPLLASQLVAPITWSDISIFSLVGFVKGFIFGLVLALFYDLFIGMKHMCCRKKCGGSACNCEGGCKCCSSGREGGK